MKLKHAVVIIAALIELAGVIIAAIIGVAWGKNNVTIIVQQYGKNIVLNDEDIQKMALENETLRNQISIYEKQIENLESESKDLTIKLGATNKELNEVPTIEFQNCGLSIDGDEKNINKDKSYVVINGRQYYSKDFVDNLLPNNMSATMKNEMLYIGKIVKEKANLLDMPVISGYYNANFYNGITDTYGNVYGRNLTFEYNNRFVIFNAEREYSYFKCTVAMQKSCNGKGSLQIIADDDVIYTSSEITNITEPFEVNIPINQASKISIGTTGIISTSRIFIANAVLYNQE